MLEYAEKKLFDRVYLICFKQLSTEKTTGNILIYKTVISQHFLTSFAIL